MEHFCDFELTPVEMHGDRYYKREDAFVLNGVCGGKARVADALIRRGIENGYCDFVTCGSRDSRQCEVVARICEMHGVRSHLFVPSGKETDITSSISTTGGATIHRTKVGYTSVLMSHSAAYAKDNGFVYIPFGLESQDTIDINMHQVRNIPSGVRRIVVPCGGGMNMVAIVRGLQCYGINGIPVLGVAVGKNPRPLLERYLDDGIFASNPVQWSVVESKQGYHDRPETTSVDGIELDPVYESKCIPFLKPGDLMWIVGKKL